MDDNNQTETVSFRATEELVEDMETEVEKGNVSSRAELIRNAIHSYLYKNGSEGVTDEVLRDAAELFEQQADRIEEIAQENARSLRKEAKMVEDKAGEYRDRAESVDTSDRNPPEAKKLRREIIESLVAIEADRGKQKYKHISKIRPTNPKVKKIADLEGKKPRKVVEELRDTDHGYPDDCFILEPNEEGALFQNRGGDAK